MITIRNHAGTEIRALLTLEEYCKLSPAQIVAIIKGPAGI
jgi:hypothetical protein